MRISRRSFALAAALSLLLAPLAWAYPTYSQVGTVVVPAAATPVAWVTSIPTTPVTPNSQFKVFMLRVKHPQQAALVPQLRVNGAIVALTPGANQSGARVWAYATGAPGTMTGQVELSSTGAAVTITPSGTTVYVKLSVCAGDSAATIGAC